ncbi:glutamate racemase [Capnocytophaga canimorsus]|uniref:glutamate racemase n=1 Tax=Capnocytophaga canimorsus TaxID=28188 RepID=UPI0037CD874D
MMITENPIGLFDSGVGGTTIWREITSLMPLENTLFLADSANAPYGIKSKEQIIALSEKNTEYLLEQNSKIIVVACNTATTNAIAHLRSKYTVPFIGIEPAIKPAALQSRTKRVGVLATRGTLSSELFIKTSNDSVRKNGILLVEQVGEGLVSLIESGALESEETFRLLQKYLQPMLLQGIDYLVLGCTHYPYLLPQIRQIVPKNIQIIDSGYAVAKQTRNVMAQHKLLQKENKHPQHRWITNGNIEILGQFASENIRLEQQFF